MIELNIEELFWDNKRKEKNPVQEEKIYDYNKDHSK